MLSQYRVIDLTNEHGMFCGYILAHLGAEVIAIEGNSYRLREHADLVPESLRGAQQEVAKPSASRRGRPREDPVNTGQ